MVTSRWHKLYSSRVAAPPSALFGLVSDLPNYTRWLPPSPRFAETTDGKPGEPGKDWWGTVIGFQPPGSLDLHQTIPVGQLKATVDVHIHYSFGPEDGGTQVTRWLVLDITMPILLRPLRRLILRTFDEENVRTMAAVKKYAEAFPDVPTPEARSVAATLVAPDASLKETGL